MQNKIFLPKDDQETPDFYTITFEYFDKSSKEYNVIFSELAANARIIDILTTDNKYKWIPLDGVKEVSYCESFTKIKIQMAKEEAQKAAAEEAKKLAENQPNKD